MSEQHNQPDNIHLYAAEQYVQDDVELLNKERVNQALERSEFIETPELRQGVETFYADHGKLDGLIKETLSGEQGDVAETSTGLQSIIDESYFKPRDLDDMVSGLIKHGNPSPNFVQAALPVLASVRLARLGDPDNTVLRRAELMALTNANRCLYAEASVAVTTVSETDKQAVADNAAAIKQAVVESDLFDDRGVPKDLNEPGVFQQNRLDLQSLDKPLASIEGAQDKFWEDTRFAGQLLFHNTAHMDEIWMDGGIKTRRMQQATNGKFNTPNADYSSGHLHSPTPHWSEMFDAWGYRGEGKTAGTVAMPLAEIIETTPFARDAQYGRLSLKPERVEEVVPKVTINDTSGEIGSGQTDMQGRYGTDRTFYASPKDVAPDAPLESAPDGYKYEIFNKEKDVASWIQLGNEEAMSGLSWGNGHGFPRRVVIEGVEPYAPAPGVDRTTAAKTRNAVIPGFIRDLQSESISKYGAELVVPVRSHVMNFHVPDDGPSYHKQRAQFTAAVQETS